MFQNISAAMQARMRELEAIDARDREDGTPRPKRLRQIPPDTGRFLALWCASAPAGRIIEIGTSAGYSAMWLSLACRALGRTLTTFETLPEKAALARETFRQAGIEDMIELVAGDSRDYLATMADVAFCFLDAEKEIYLDCYERVVPNLVPGGILIADNAINFRDVLQPMIDRALRDPRVDAVVLPVGTGELVCRKL